MLLCFLRLRFEKEKKKKALAGHHSGGTGKCILSLNLDPEEAGDPKCQTMRSKVLFLDSFSQGLEQLSEMQFLP